MDATPPNEDEQTKLWNGRAGRAWVDAQEVLDGMFKPFEDLLVAAVSAESGGRVLDVGCGTGSTLLAVARRLGAKGHCLGIDISEPMLALARVRAEREGTTASFIRANAQNHAFEPASFDLIISRFGVMFFDDPVRAFENLRRAARHDAELRFIAWRSAADNPFMTTAERAAAPLLPNLPVRKPGGPGQFAFADRNRGSSILEESGWAEIELQPIDVACTLPEKELLGYVTRLGPVGLLLQEADDQTRTQVIETVRAAFAPYVHGAEVRFTAACWQVTARAR
ncbi:class I SAM-dependent methyltransferase [Corallococcus sp. CA053C]|uniref:class I SAM-dependent methyltransferase n=1 Tax=Corallococcus sp. CA053C TaxID=2316732 RepID=UPI000EA197A8|nr:class I SAM-dependent methyltransferase [Corallococcus sp. CA053C]RKH07127.1 class I SAM-dependent methyltransferase [Corallococcus sp. CA053C]